VRTLEDKVQRLGDTSGGGFREHREVACGGGFDSDKPDTPDKPDKPDKPDSGDNER